MRPMEISVVIITYNEEAKIEAALKSVADIASEIIVVDRHSTDETVKIARKYTDRVLLREWTNYADQKNYGNAKASYPWILSLDADERVSDELRKEIQELKSKEPECAAFSMPRQTFYLGRWIRHSGWYPDRKIRLFLKDKARWEGEYVHEALVVDGKVCKLKGLLHHFTYDNIHDHIDRLNTFSGLSAQKGLENAASSPILAASPSSWTLRPKGSSVGLSDPPMIPLNPFSFRRGRRPKIMSGWTLITMAISALGTSFGR